MCVSTDVCLCACIQVSDCPESGPPTPAPAEGIVGALMEVMKKRSKAIRSSGERSPHIATPPKRLRISGHEAT